MSRFATKKTNTTKTVNLAGGESYKNSPELELASILLTSFTADKHYRTSNEEVKRLRELLKVVDAEFACKAAVYARQVAGMRSISHLLTAEIAPYISGTSFARSFYNAVIRRPDDFAEILSYAKSINWGYKTLPKAMERGFKDAFKKFDEYQLAKWRKENNSINLLNIVHLTHPVPNNALNKLYKNRLKLKKGTRESMLADTGQIENRSSLSLSEIQEIKAENLKEGWKQLLSTRKIGYKALVGSLVKIINEAPDMIDITCDILSNKELVRKSLVMPSELIIAFEEVIKNNSYNSRKVLSALEVALEYSVDNAPLFFGKTLVCLDVSGSMSGKPSRIGGLFSAVLCKKNKCDMMQFNTSGKYVNYNPNDSIGTLYKQFTSGSGGTDFKAIFRTAKDKYDRIIILSDMQSWVGYHSPKDVFNTYCKTYNVNPYIYSWDLQGYGTTQFPSNKIFAIAGFNNNVF